VDVAHPHTGPLRVEASSVNLLRYPLGLLHDIKCHPEGHLPCRRPVEESDVLPGEALEHAHADVSLEESSDEVHRDFERARVERAEQSVACKELALNSPNVTSMINGCL